MSSSEHFEPADVFRILGKTEIGINEFSVLLGRNSEEMCKVILKLRASGIAEFVCSERDERLSVYLRELRFCGFERFKDSIGSRPIRVPECFIHSFADKERLVRWELSGVFFIIGRCI